MSQVAFALQQALIAASRDSGQRFRALSALKGAEVWSITWPTDQTSPRTLTSSAGVVALPVFTDERLLATAAMRYGWQSGDGRVPHKKLHIAEAMRAAKLSSATLIIVDMASEHALELDPGEMDYVASLPSTRPPMDGRAPSSPTGTGSGTEVARASTRPPPGVSGRASVRPASADGTSRTPSVGSYGPFPGETTSARVSALRPRSITPHPAEHAVSATFGATQTSTMVALERSPTDALLDELSSVLKEYPEVEWAQLVGAPASEFGPQSSIALRIAPDFRVNLAEISRRLREAAHAMNQRCDVVVLDTPEQMKEARLVGVPFYPWRKK